MRNQANILNILFIYNIEAMNISAGFSAWTNIYVMVFHPLPYYLAQLSVLVIWCGGAVSIILNSAIPLFKIIFVTNFDFIFAQDPEILGKRILIVSLVLGCAPPSLICIYQFSQGIVATSSVAFLMGDNPEERKVVPLMPMYSGIWIIINLIVLSFTLVFIPCYIKRNHRSIISAEPTQMEEETKNIHLGRMLFGSIVAIMCTLVATIISKMSNKAVLGI